jgi:hypothetical protein
LIKEILFFSYQALVLQGIGALQVIFKPKKAKNNGNIKKSGPRAENNPGGLSKFCHIHRIENRIQISAVERMSQWKMYRL